MFTTAEFMDLKMKEVLMITPTWKQKDKVKITEITHNVNTWGKAEHNAYLRIEVEERRIATKGSPQEKETREKRELIALDVEKLKALQSQEMDR